MTFQKLSSFLQEIDAVFLSQFKLGGRTIRRYACNGYHFIVELYGNENEPEGFDIFVPASQENNIDKIFQSVREFLGKSTQKEVK